MACLPLSLSAVVLFSFSATPGSGEQAGNLNEVQQLRKQIGPKLFKLQTSVSPAQVNLPLIIGAGVIESSHPQGKPE